MASERIVKYREYVETQWSYKWWNWIMQYRDLRIDLVYDDDKLDWQELVENPNMQLSLLRDKFDELILNGSEWNLFKNPNMTWDFVDELLNNGFTPCSSGWMYISRLDTLSWATVNKHMDYPWDWSELSSNPSIPIDVIMTHPELPWDQDAVARRNEPKQAIGDPTWCDNRREVQKSACPNIRFADIDATLDKSEWNWMTISYNPFTAEKAHFCEYEYRKYMAAYRIQRWWLFIRRKTKLSN